MRGGPPEGGSVLLGSIGCWGVLGETLLTKDTSPSASYMIEPNFQRSSILVALSKIDQRLGFL